RILAAGLKPVLPDICARAELFFDAPVVHWDDFAEPLLGHRIATYEALLTRIDPKQIEAMIESSRENLKPTEDTTVGAASAANADAPKKNTHVVAHAASRTPTTGAA